MDVRREFRFPEDRLPERLDRYLAESLPELTRSQVKRLVESGEIRVDGQPVKAGYRLRGGQVLAVRIPAAVPAAARPEEIPLDILYEDRCLVVLNKPPGLVVHPAPGHSGGTLVNALLHHCPDLAGIGGELRPGIVHRLDKGTSGVMVVTKDEVTHNDLAGQFKAHSISRSYLALVHGVVQKDRGTVDRPIGRHPVDRKKMSSKSRAGRRAVTHWEVLRRFDRDRLTLLELRLETGRTHQIRVHLSELNLPLVGDPVYGRPSRASALSDLHLRQLVQKLQRQFLHARMLGFRHPASHSWMEFTSPLPEDLAGILHYLETSYQDLPPIPGASVTTESTTS